MTNVLINHACVMEPPPKSPTQRLIEVPVWWAHHHGAGRGHGRGEGKREREKHLNTHQHTCTVVHCAVPFFQMAVPELYPP